jgi:hypothetical protein
MLLSGCSSQAALDHAKTICRDNVEYLVYIDPGYIRTVVPHFKPDGSLYTCGGAA